MALWWNGFGGVRVSQYIVPGDIVELGEWWELRVCELVFRCAVAVWVSLAMVLLLRGSCGCWQCCCGKLLDVVRCVWGCLYGYVRPSGGEASGVPRFTVIVGGADSPLSADEVLVADGARGVFVWDSLWLHGTVCACWQGYAAPSLSFVGGLIVVFVGGLVGVLGCVCCGRSWV